MKLSEYMRHHSWCGVFTSLAPGIIITMRYSLSLIHVAVLYDLCVVRLWYVVNLCAITYSVAIESQYFYPNTRCIPS